MDVQVCSVVCRVGWVLGVPCFDWTQTQNHSREGWQSLVFEGSFCLVVWTHWLTERLMDPWLTAPQFEVVSSFQGTSRVSIRSILARKSLIIKLVSFHCGTTSNSWYMLNNMLQEILIVVGHNFSQWFGSQDTSLFLLPIYYIKIQRLSWRLDVECAIIMHLAAPQPCLN